MQRELSRTTSAGSSAWYDLTALSTRIAFSGPLIATWVCMWTQGTHLAHDAHEGPAADHVKGPADEQLMEAGADEEHQDHGRRAAHAQPERRVVHVPQQPLVHGHVPQAPVLPDSGGVPPVLHGRLGGCARQLGSVQGLCMCTAQAWRLHLLSMLSCPQRGDLGMHPARSQDSISAQYMHLRSPAAHACALVLSLDQAQGETEQQVATISSGPTHDCHQAALAAHGNPGTKCPVLVQQLASGAASL